MPPKKTKTKKPRQTKTKNTVTTKQTNKQSVNVNVKIEQPRRSYNRRKTTVATPTATPKQSQQPQIIYRDVYNSPPINPNHMQNSAAINKVGPINPTPPVIRPATNPMFEGEHETFVNLDDNSSVNSSLTIPFEDHPSMFSPKHNPNHFSYSGFQEPINMTYNNPMHISHTPSIAPTASIVDDYNSSMASNSIGVSIFDQNRPVSGQKAETQNEAPVAIAEEYTPVVESTMTASDMKVRMDTNSDSTLKKYVKLAGIQEMMKLSNLSIKKGNTPKSMNDMIKELRNHYKNGIQEATMLVDENFINPDFLGDIIPTKVSSKKGKKGKK